MNNKFFFYKGKERSGKELLELLNEGHTGSPLPWSLTEEEYFLNYREGCNMLKVVGQFSYINHSNVWGGAMSVEVGGLTVMVRYISEGSIIGLQNEVDTYVKALKEITQSLFKTGNTLMELVEYFK